MSSSIQDSDIYNTGKQLFRYGLLGIVNNSSGYIVFLSITFLGIGPKIAMTLLYAIGATIGFFGNRKWTFAHNGSLLGSSARYVIAHLLGYLINLILFVIFVDKLGYSYQLVQAAAIFVVAGFLFVTFKYFVFHNS